MDDREQRRQKAERYIMSARAVLLWERIWPGLWPGLGVIGVAMILALVGALALLPGAVHTILLLMFFGSLIYLFWRSFASFRTPRWDEGARRVERDSDLPNRPITEGMDVVAAGRGDPFSERLWRAHIVRLLTTAKSLRLKLPSPGLGRRDPKGLRYAVLLGVVVGFVIAGPRAGDRLLNGLMPVFGETVDNSVFVAWVAPPAYTSLPPRSLTDTTVMSETGDIQAPVNSTLVMRLRGTSSRPTIDARPVPKGGQPVFVKSELGYEAKVNLPVNSRVAVRLGSRSYGDWRFVIIPDQKPTAQFTEQPTAQQNQALKLAYKAADDYGVAKMAALVVPLDDKGAEIATAEKLEVELPAPGSGKSVANIVYRDLTAHAYAGLKVHIRLQATDAAGQTGDSAPLTIELPHRVFTEPLAQSLIEQRKNLAMEGDPARDRVLAAVDALSLGPDQFYKDDYSNYLALRALNYRLDDVKADPGFKSSQVFMWDMALAIEEGDLANAAEELRKLQEQLQEALERGAPDEEIKALLDRLRQAMNRYMQQLARNAQRGQQQSQMSPPNSRTMSQRDLQDLLKAIEDLARTGNRDQARQMLAALMQMLENMRMVQGGPGQQGQQGQQQQTPQQNAMNDALKGLSDLMGNQRNLLDRTMRAQQGQRGQQGQQGQQGQRGQQGQQGQGQQGQGQQGQQGQGQQGQGQMGQNGQQGQPGGGQPGQGQPGQGQQGQPGGMSPGALAQQQQGLRDALDKIIQGLAQNGVPAPGLNDAQQAMGQSRENLQGGQLESSQEAQQQALDRLRDSAQQLAKNMMAQNGDQQGDQQGQQGQKTDPLGRPLDQQGSMAGGVVKLPDQSDLARAREILDELRRRSGEASRAQQELEYIERLLKQF